MSIGEPSFVLTAILTLLLKLINTLFLLRRPKEKSCVLGARKRYLHTCGPEGKTEQTRSVFKNIRIHANGGII